METSVSFIFPQQRIKPCFLGKKSSAAKGILWRVKFDFGKTTDLQENSIRTSDGQFCFKYSPKICVVVKSIFSIVTGSYGKRAKTSTALSNIKQIASMFLL